MLNQVVSLCVVLSLSFALRIKPKAGEVISEQTVQVSNEASVANEASLAASNEAAITNTCSNTVPLANAVWKTCTENAIKSEGNVCEVTCSNSKGFFGANVSSNTNSYKCTSGKWVPQGRLVCCPGVVPTCAGTQILSCKSGTVACIARKNSKCFEITTNIIPATSCPTGTISNGRTCCTPDSTTNLCS